MPTCLNQTFLYIVVPTMSPNLAAVIHKEPSPLSEIITDLFKKSKDLTSSISFFKNFLSPQGHSPKGKKCSFSPCQYLIALKFPYLSVISFNILRIFSCCCSLFKFFAQPGVWHSGHRGAFMPTAKSILTSLFSASFICQSKSSKLNFPSSGSIKSQ